MKYAIVIERGTRNYSAFVPDLPGCIATGATIPVLRKNVREAISFHLDGLREDGLPVPKPAARAEYVSPPRRTPLPRPARRAGRPLR
ncbi:MAG: type II toxin-antitoxin system HicB family antitoxin [Phycisphaerales bacterium]